MIHLVRQVAQLAPLLEVRLVDQLHLRAAMLSGRAAKPTLCSLNQLRVLSQWPDVASSASSTAFTSPGTFGGACGEITDDLETLIVGVNCGAVFVDVLCVRVVSLPCTHGINTSVFSSKVILTSSDTRRKTLSLRGCGEGRASAFGLWGAPHAGTPTVN